MTPIEKARHEAATSLNIAPAEVMATDLTDAVPWVQKHTLVAAGEAGNTRTFAVDAAGKVLSFRPGDVESLNHFFEVENIALPAGLPPEHLADAIRLLVAGPGGFVASPKFLEAERADLTAWLRAPQDRAEELFEAHCEAPTLQHDGDRWLFAFCFFNPRGAVERWNVEGHPNTIDAASFDLALPEWTFRYPYV